MKDRKEYLSNWYRENHERECSKRTNHNREHRQQNRKMVLDAYGGKCAICGEAHWECLTLDHSWNDGADHRRKMSGTNRGGTSAVYRDIVRRGFPGDEGYRVLCWNCNCSIGSYGYSPLDISGGLKSLEERSHES